MERQQPQLGEGFNREVEAQLDAVAYEAGVENYLAYTEGRPPRAEVEVQLTSGYMDDLAWGRTFTGESSRMPVLVAERSMQAAHHYLRGLAGLLTKPGVDLAVEDLARSCSEATGRVLWVLDLKVDPRDRMVRALNAAFTNRRFKKIVVKEASRMGLAMQKDRKGKDIGVEPAEQRVDGWAASIGPLVGDDADARRLWSLWSQASHGDLGAAMSLWLREGEVGSRMLNTAALTAAVAHMSASHRLDEYTGVLHQPRWQAAAAQLTLSLIQRQPGTFRSNTAPST